MGSSKSQETTVVNQQTTPEMTEAEKKMQELQLGQYQQIVGPQTQVQLAGLDLVNQLLMGQEPTSPLYQQISGISSNAIGTQAAELARQNMPGFQSLGLADSGVAYRETARDIANQLLFPAEQYNIGAKQNLLNLALSGQAQVQSPIMAGQQILSQQLQGLRPTNFSGYQQTVTRNPFLTGSDIFGGIGTGLGAYAALKSSIRFKKNVKKWVKH